jgi:stage II sporulation protein Q
MVAAAIILSLMWAYQGNDDQQLATDVNPGGLTVSEGLTNTSDPMFPDVDTAPVNGPVGEVMQWPVVDADAITVLMPFYDESAPKEERAAALVQQGNTFKPHMGVSIGMGDDQEFDVAAAMSGTVTRVQTLPMVGNLVEITHDNGLVTVYQSLQNVTVNENDQVVQGQVFAQAGRNELERDLGVHLHFEVRDGEQALNPQDELPVLATDLADEEAAEEEVAEEEATEDEVAEEDEATEDSASEDSASEEQAENNDVVN